MDTKSNEPERPKNKWQAMTIVFALVSVALAAGLFYVVLQLQFARDDRLSLTAERDDLQSQLSELQASRPLKDTDKTDTKTSTQNIPDNSYKSVKGVSITINSPAPGSTSLASPLTVKGQVPGNWSQEGQFPITFKDSSGKTVATGTAKLDGDWQTDQLVDFSATLTWDGMHRGTHTLVFEKANPSGLEANADSVEVTFELK